MTRYPRALRPVMAAAALSCLTALISACGGGNPVPTKTVTVSATAAAPVTVSASAAATASPAPASPAVPAWPAPCATRDLQVKLGLAQGAAGSIYQVIDFTNIGTAICSLYGYPGVSLAGGTPVSQIGLAAKEDPTTPRKLVTLAPGTVGNALLRLVQAGFFPAAKCAPVNSRFLQIYPPNQTTPAYLSYKAQTCSKSIQQLTISVVKPGSGG